MTNNALAHDNDKIVEDIRNTENSYPQHDKVVFITWDGVRPKWMKELTADGTLYNTSRVLTDGHLQQVRITNHNTGTNPGMAAIESGYGPNINQIHANQFGPGSDKLSIPEGLTISERLRAHHGTDIKIGMFFSWSYHQVNDDYMNQSPNGENYTDPIFENIRPGSEVDYWFAAENLSWTPEDEECKRAALNGFNEKYQLYYDPLIRAQYIAEHIVDFISNYSSDNFYIRAHFTEPDNRGHGYGESYSSNRSKITPEYLNALLACDEATGMILDALEDTGIFDDTLVIIGTDHGFFGKGHDEDPWPSTLTEVVEQYFAISDLDFGSTENIAVDQCDFAPSILESMGVNISTLDPLYLGDEDTGIPMWKRVDEDPVKIRKLQFSTATEGYKDVTEDTELPQQFNLRLQVVEWSEITNASIITNDQQPIAANTKSNIAISWSNLIATQFEVGEQEITFYLEDQFGNITEKTYTIIIASSGGIPFLFLSSLVGLAAAIIFVKKKR